MKNSTDISKVKASGVMYDCSEANSPPATPPRAPASRKTIIRSLGLAMPDASAATSASRIATSARP